MTRFSQCAVAAIGDSHEKDERQYGLGHEQPDEHDQDRPSQPRCPDRHGFRHLRGEEQHPDQQSSIEEDGPVDAIVYETETSCTIPGSAMPPIKLARTIPCETAFSEWTSIAPVPALPPAAELNLCAPAPENRPRRQADAFRHILRG